MITKTDLLNDGWIPTEDKGFFAKGKLEKKEGRTTYMVHAENKLWIGVFKASNPDKPFSMCMRGVLYNGDCPNMDTFNYIFNLVRLKESEPK